jgi:hypothetical protein
VSMVTLQTGLEGSEPGSTGVRGYFRPGDGFMNSPKYGKMASIRLQRPHGENQKLHCRPCNVGGDSWRRGLGRAPQV